MIILAIIVGNRDVLKISKSKRDVGEAVALIMGTGLVVCFIAQGTMFYVHEKLGKAVIFSTFNKVDKDNFWLVALIV